MDIKTFDRFVELSFRLNCGVELLTALYTVMRNDEYTSADLAPALCAGYLYISGISAELDALIHQQEVRVP